MIDVNKALAENIINLHMLDFEGSELCLCAKNAHKFDYNYSNFTKQS